MTLGPAYNNLRLGWIELVEPLYTSSNTFVVDGTENIPLSGPFMREEGDPGDIWNEDLLKLEPEEVDDFYYFPISFKTTAPLGAGNFVEISLEVDGVQKWCDSEPLIFPLGTEQCHGFIVPIAVDQDFVDNGGFIKIRTPLATETYDWKLVINKTFNR